MALWDKLSNRGNVQDRRGMRPAAIGGLSLTGLAVVLLLNVITGGDLTDIVSQIDTTAVQNQETDSSEFQGEDEYEVFASTVLGSNNTMWQEKFSQQNLSYTEPTLVLFRQATQSGCGTATSQVGPHYCPADSTIYLDETFFDELKNRLGAEGGDVAEAYVIAHEVAHHAQNELGTMDNLDSRSNADSIKIELQADCYAGMWANSIKDLQVLEPNEIKEAMDAAAAVGDDRIQEKVTGQINPEGWTHGSSEERVKWFTIGYETGSLSACDTFSN